MRFRVCPAIGGNRSHLHGLDVKNAMGIRVDYVKPQYELGAVSVPDEYSPKVPIENSPVLSAGEP